MNKSKTCFYDLELTGQLCFVIVSDAKTRALTYFANSKIIFFNFNI